jgi:serine/threonine-protein kinase
MTSPDGQIAGSGDPLVGQVLFDRYRVVRKLETRSGAALYAAQHVLANRSLAVEVLAGGPVGDVDRFLEESRTIARVGHENVVEIFNGGRAPSGAVFLAMEALEGTSLAALVARDGPILWDRAQGIVQQIAAALSAVHRHGVVHGDINAENVVVVPRTGRRDFVKLLDFGVARAGTRPGPGALPATPDPRDDVRGLGRLTYLLVTGTPPADEAPAAPSTLRPQGSLPADLDGVLLRALEADPEKRWPDIATFSDAIARCRLTRRQSVRVEALAMAELSGKTDAFEADARRRRRTWSIASVVVGVAIAIAVIHLIKTAPGHVQILTWPSDADLTFNGLPVQARSPVVLEAAPGRYTLTVSRPGYVTAERTVDVAARETVSVPVQLAALPGTPPPAAAVEPAPTADPAAAPARAP